MIINGLRYTAQLMSFWIFWPLGGFGGHSTDINRVALRFIGFHRLILGTLGYHIHRIVSANALIA